MYILKPPYVNYNSLFQILHTLYYNQIDYVTKMYPIFKLMNL
jgi:hypothetical protein